jgi:hydrogenase-4 membrane subunit HyfE
MTIGSSIFLIAVGAILAFAVNATVAGISIQTAGLILMIAGAIGLLIGLFMMTTRRSAGADPVYDERTTRYR